MLRRTAPLLVLVLGLCGSAYAGNIQAGHAQIDWVPTSLGSSASISVGISNNGPGPLTVTSIAMSGAAGFAVSAPTLPVTIAANASLDVTVSFTPQTDSGLLRSNLVITSDADNTPSLMVPFEGCAGPPVLSFDPPSLDFGKIAVGAPMFRPFAIVNAGCDTLALSSITIAGDFFASVPSFVDPCSNETCFVVQGSGTEDLDAGERFSFEVAFGPQSAGLGTGSLIATANVSSPTATLTGTGTLGYLSANFSQLEFFDQVGQAASPRPVTLRNDSAYTVEVQDVVFSDSAYSVASGTTLPFTLTPNQSGVVAITCTPAHLGAHDATATIVTSGASLSIALECIGGPTLYVDDPYLGSFGHVPLGIHRDHSFSIGNFGLVPITINSVSITGPAAGDFVLDPALAQLQVLPPEETTHVMRGLQFRPSALGYRAATLTIESNDPNTPVFTMELSGYGISPMLTLSAYRLDFGDSIVGVEKTLTIDATNDSGETFSAVLEIEGPFTSDVFSFSPLVILPGETRSIAFRFAPDTVGPVSGTALLHLSDPPLALPLTGNGVFGGLAFVPESGEIDLGMWPVGETSPPKTLLLRNVSAQPLGISSIATTNLAFSLTHDAPLELQPGQSTTVQVTYQSLQLGEVTGEIWVCVPLTGYIAPACSKPVVTLSLRARGGEVEGCAAGRQTSLWLALLVLALRRRRRR